MTQPPSREDKMARLAQAARIAEAVSARLRIGESIAALRTFAATTPDLSLRETDDGIVCRLGDKVDWTVMVDGGGTVRGYTFSGFDALMAELGVDFAGQSYGSGGTLGPTAR